MGLRGIPVVRPADVMPCFLNFLHLHTKCEGSHLTTTRRALQLADNRIVLTPPGASRHADIARPSALHALP